MITNEWIAGKDDFSVVLKIRKEVFGDDKKDKHDDYAMHLAVYENGEPAACGRLFVGEKNRFFIDLVGVREKFRHEGIGDLAAKLLLYRASSFAKSISAKIPDDLVPFFARYGFKKDGEIYTVIKEEIIYPSKCGKH